MPTGNPFHYGTPVEGAQFAGREPELEALLSRMTNRVNVVLISPRRYGKTSLLVRAAAQLATSDPPGAVVQVNVLRCRDLATLAAQLTAGVYRMPRGRWRRAREALPQFVRRLRVRPTVSFDELGRPLFTFGTGLAPQDGDQLISDLYSLMAQEAGHRPAVLILDEFQAITDHGDRLPSLLKALADQHPEVSLVLAGSRQHLMERLVTAQGAPLYGMAQRLALGPIPDQVMVDFLGRRARAGGKEMDEESARLLLRLAGPVPNDVQHLAYEAFEVSGPLVDAVAVERGLAQAVAHEDSTYADVFSRRSPGQRRVLMGLAMGPDDPIFSAAFARSAGLAGSNSVKKALLALEELELVTTRDGRPVVADPFFAAWLRPSQELEPAPS